MKSLILNFKFGVSVCGIKESKMAVFGVKVGNTKLF